MSQLNYPGGRPAGDAPEHEQADVAAALDRGPERPGQAGRFAGLGLHQFLAEPGDRHRASDRGAPTPCVLLRRSCRHTPAPMPRAVTANRAGERKRSDPRSAAPNGIGSLVRPTVAVAIYRRTSRSSATRPSRVKDGSRASEPRCSTASPLQPGPPAPVTRPRSGPDRGGPGVGHLHSRPGETAPSPRTRADFDVIDRFRRPPGFQPAAHVSDYPRGWRRISTNDTMGRCRTPPTPSSSGSGCPSVLPSGTAARHSACRNRRWPRRHGGVGNRSFGSRPRRTRRTSTGSSSLPTYLASALPNCSKRVDLVNAGVMGGRPARHDPPLERPDRRPA